jgi:RimJ/RimL family protein N-acetyltransferase
VLARSGTASAESGAVQSAEPVLTGQGTKPVGPQTETLAASFGVTADRPPLEMCGPRVVVRRYSTSDAVDLHEAIGDSVEHLVPWMPWAALEPMAVADRHQLIAGWLEGWATGVDFNFGVFERERLVGGCGLHRRIGPHRLEIGYWTRAGETGRGVATEAAGCLVAGAFTMADVEGVEIHHDAANVASSRVPERLGFTFIEARVDGVAAPAEVGVEWVWRLERPATGDDD